MDTEAQKRSAETLRAFFEGRARAEAEANRELGRRLAGAATALAQRLYAAGAEQVFLFGSVAAQRVHARSDIDLATEGLPAAVYFPVLGELLMAAPCGVDLVRLEDAPPSLRACVEETGILLPRDADAGRGHDPATREVTS